MRDELRISQLREAAKLASELEQAVSEGKGGWPDERSLRRVRDLVGHIRLCGLDSYAREKLGKVEHYAPILYSVRKHERFPSGAQGVHVTMLGAANILRSVLERQLREAEDGSD